MEHHSNIVPWYWLKERQGAVLKWAPISDDGELLLDKFEALLTVDQNLPFRSEPPCGPDRPKGRPA